MLLRTMAVQLFAGLDNVIMDISHAAVELSVISKANIDIKKYIMPVSDLLVRSVWLFRGYLTNVAIIDYCVCC